MAAKPQAPVDFCSQTKLNQGEVYLNKCPSRFVEKMVNFIPEGDSSVQVCFFSGFKRNQSRSIARFSRGL